MHKGKHPSFISSATCTSVLQKLDSKSLHRYANGSCIYSRDSVKIRNKQECCFHTKRKSTVGIVMQEPALWINWEQETPNTERKEPAASQKIENTLIKYLNAGEIMGWGFLLMLHGFLMSIKAVRRVKSVLRKNTSYLRDARTICSDCDR